MKVARLIKILIKLNIFIYELTHLELQQYLPAHKSKMGLIKLVIIFQNKYGIYGCEELCNCFLTKSDLKNVSFIFKNLFAEIENSSRLP